MPRFKRIKSDDELIPVLKELPSVDLACRGQGSAHDHLLTARIDRCLDGLCTEDHLLTERAVCQRFREHAPIYLSTLEAEYLKTPWLQLVVMQHYGAPTRLLDWTKSPWVAAYFAVSSDWKSDGYVYVFPRIKLEADIRSRFRPELKELTWGPHGNEMGFSDDRWDLAGNNATLFDLTKVNQLSEWVTTYYCRKAHFPRLVAQQGLFTFASKPRVNHWQHITGCLSADDCWLIEIASDAKAACLRILNHMGLNGATLFPGADGIGRSLEGFARAWHLDPRPPQFGRLTSDGTDGP